MRMIKKIDHAIVGVWRAVAHETILDDGETVRQFGDAPRGRLILTDTGHMTGFVTASDRTPGHSDEQRADLHRSMIAYSGTYRVDADRFFVAVDLSWHALWDGTEQARTFRIDGDHLHIVSAAGPSQFRPGRTSHSHLSWVREG